MFAKSGNWAVLHWRGRLRLASALVLLSFVICHLTAHCLLLVSFEDAEVTRNVVMYPWRTWIGTGILTAAFIVHFSNALWSIYFRRALRLSRWEWTQLTLGLCIPPLLMTHVVATRIAEEALDVTTYYNTVFIVQWLMFPWLGAVQMIAVVTVWTHACIGIHYWLRTKRWYPDWRPLLFGFALLLPSLALAGYVTGGNQVLREAKADPDFVASSLGDSNLTPETAAAIDRIVYVGWGIWLGLVLFPFAGRGLRAWHDRRRKPPMLSHANGRSVPILPGATVLETLRAHGIAHASVCGGRARCTTCRVLVTKGLDRLPAPAGQEAKALSRIGATPGMRLACQIPSRCRHRGHAALGGRCQRRRWRRARRTGRQRASDHGGVRRFTRLDDFGRGQAALRRALYPQSVFPRNDPSACRHPRALFANSPAMA